MVRLDSRPQVGRERAADLAQQLQKTVSLDSLCGN
jgi:hypothetical protein